MPAILQIVVSPVRGPPAGAFDAFVDGYKLCRSNAPFLDAARKLAAMGAVPDTVLEMWHSGATTWALRGWVHVLARLRIAESGTGRPCVRQWRPYQGRHR